MKPVAFLAHQASVGPGMIGRVLDEDGVERIVVRAYDEHETWPAASDVSALVVLGGDMNVDATSRHPYLLRSRDLVEEVMDAEIPVLGICLGAQMIARVLGAEVRAGAARQVGFLPLQPTGEEDAVLAPVDALARVFQWHEDALTLPPGAVLLHQDDIAPQSFRYRDTTYAIQFHVEITRSILQQWCRETSDLENDWNTSRDELMDQARDHLEAQQQAAAAVTRAFVSLA